MIWNNDAENSALISQEKRTF